MGGNIFMIYYIKTPIILTCILVIKLMASEYAALIPYSNTLALSKDIRHHIKNGDVHALRDIARTPDFGSAILAYSKKIEIKYKDKKKTCCYNEKAANAIVATGSAIACIDAIIGLTGLVLTIASNPIGTTLNGAGLLGLGSLVVSSIPVIIISSNSAYAETIVQNQKSIQRFLRTRPDSNNLSAESDDADMV